MTSDSSIISLTDEELAVRVAAGSRVCFEELVSRYSPRLCSFLRPRIASEQDTEDLVQETFLRVFRSIARFDPEKKFSTWMYTVAVRLAISHYRTRKPAALGTDLEEDAQGPQDRLIRKQSAQNFWDKAREELKPREYEALWLRYVEEEPVKDIARIMRKTPVAVRVTLHRARLRLAEKLEFGNKEKAALAMKGDPHVLPRS